jgi:C1A family cysteine protease
MKQDPKTIINTDNDPGLHRKPIVHQITKIKLPMRIPKFHWVRDIPDTRDYKYALTNVRQTNIVDLRPYCSSIEDQGNLGSCTGNAIAGAIELLNKRENKTFDVSRLFIYYFERLFIGTVNYDSGAYIRDGIKTCYMYGASLESLWPYVINKFKTRPSSSAVNDASNRKVTLYQRIVDHQGCLDALSNGYPVVVGFDVYSSFQSSIVARTGIMPYPNTKKESLLGGHAVLLVGYDKNKQVYIARNSWGSRWGDKGYFYMPFQVIQNPTMSGDFWIIKSVSNP